MDSFVSTIDKDLRVVNGKASIVPKEYPKWYGIKDIGFIWHGEWADPEIEYNGYQFNQSYVKDSMWEQFWDEYPNGTDEEFEKYMIDNVDDVYFFANNIVEAIKEGRIEN